MACIGIDFDNTIVCYDEVFYPAAKKMLSLPEHVGRSKDEIRDYLRAAGQELLWTELQGYVYGAMMPLTRPFCGVERFLAACASQQTEVCIISHKTIHPYRGPAYNLHQAARDWLQSFPIFHKASVFFELTLREKLSRIETAQCCCFIDDLPELLLESSFPAETQKILFDPQDRHPPNPRYLKFTSWDAIGRFLGVLA